jgi:peptidoglycan LD-endopeptidase LytH
MRQVEQWMRSVAVALVLVGAGSTIAACSQSAPSLVAAPGKDAVDPPASTIPSTASSVIVQAPSASTTVESTTTAAAAVTGTNSAYVFPVLGAKASYARTHHDYPASDVFACGAYYIAATGGTIAETSTVDRWDADVNDPATRGGLFVSLVGDDGVRYYGSHLDQVLVQPGDVVEAGDPLGVIGKTGNARDSACHLHFGISRPCDGPEWAVRRGEIWPWPYLDAWRDAEQKSPALEIFATVTDVPGACEFAEGTNAAASESD